MSKLVKNIAVVINLLIFVLAIFWIKKSDFDYEPITVFLGQFLSLIVLVFGDTIQNKFSVKGVSGSKVEIDSDLNDNADYDISDITDNSEVRIKRN